MNPLRWVRWKVVAVLAVLGGIVYFLGLDRVALSKINTAGQECKAARWTISDFAMGLLTGDAALRTCRVDAEGRRRTRVFNRPRGLDVAMGDLLARRYYVDEVKLRGQS
jgi:hypothetical protein